MRIDALAERDLADAHESVTRRSDRVTARLFEGGLVDDRHRRALVADAVSEGGRLDELARVRSEPGHHRVLEIERCPRTAGRP